MEIRDGSTERARARRDPLKLDPRQIARQCGEKRYPEKRAARYKKWRDANREKKIEQTKAWQKQNPEKLTAYNAGRHARKMNATVLWADSVRIEKIYCSARNLTRLTGIKHHVDHIVPLQGRNVCGLHVETNLRVITARENISKHNKWGDDGEDYTP